MARSSFHGMITYLVSPVDLSGAVRTEVLARLCEDLIHSGVRGLAPLSFAGEFLLGPEAGGY